MFDAEFFPTPYGVVERMLDCYKSDFNGCNALEPSAGSGNILEQLNGRGAKTWACEKNPELALITKGKSDVFLNYDFFEVRQKDISHIDLIVMNPPFSNADKHILHAWKEAPDGCMIIALCNSSTILDPNFSRSRKELSAIIHKHGNIDLLGSCFDAADRKTNVDVAMVVLEKPKSMDDTEWFIDEDPDEVEQQVEGLMQYNAVRDAVSRYVTGLEIYKSVVDNGVKMNNAVGIFGVDSIVFNIKNDKAEISFETFKTELQKKAWAWVFQQLKMEKFLTEKLMSELHKFIEKQQNVPFTMRNIYKMLDTIIGTHGTRMRNALVDASDRLTTHYHENRHHVEGWKTNSHYMVNKKFILSGFNNYHGFGDGIHVYFDWRCNSQNLVDDLVKGLNFLTGERFNQNLHDANRKGKWKYGEWNEFTYFTIKFFKKGTMHAKFNDDKIWELFNREVAKTKGFELPDKI